MTLEDAVARHASATPAAPAVIDAEGSHSYAQLWQAVCARADMLRRSEAWAVAYRMEPAYPSVVSYLSIHRAGKVAVPVEKDYPEGPLSAMSARMNAAAMPQATADILFTTGTTGARKGVMVSQEAIMANAGNLIHAQGYHPGLTFIITGPLNHIGCLSKLYTSLTVGASVHLLDGLRDMNAFFQAIARASRAATFQVPSSLSMLMALGKGDLQRLGHKIELVETGAAPMAESDMDRLAALLPHTRLYNTYASTETGIVTTHCFSHAPRRAGLLGRAMRHSHIETTAEGLVACSGPTLMSGYWDDEALTARTLHDGRLITHDRAFIDGDGCLHLLGRADDTINTGGFKVDPAEVENEVMRMEGVADCICIAAAHPVLQQALKLLVVTQGGPSPSFREIAAFLLQRLESYKIPLLYEYVDAVERTYNGKLNRKYYVENPS